MIYWRKLESIIRKKESYKYINISVRKNLKVNHLKFKSELFTNGFFPFLKHK